jgi:hypothetical protein
MDRRSIKIFKGHDGRTLAQIMQSENGEYEVWVREMLKEMLGGNLRKHRGKHSNLAAARATGDRILSRYNLTRNEGAFRLGGDES